jgi:glutathione S-transferase
MQLYYAPGACSLAPHIVLSEAGIACELKKVDLHTGEVEGGGKISDVNSKGYVPALRLDNGNVLTEGPAIVQFLADQKPQSGLAPAAGTYDRYRLQEWLNFIGTELHKSFGVQFSPAAAAEWKAGEMDKVTRRLAWLDKQLPTRNYLLGEQFTVADAYLFVVLSWAPYIKVDLSKWPAITSYVQRIAARPKVQDALKAEGLLH